MNAVGQPVKMICLSSLLALVACGGMTEAQFGVHASAETAGSPTGNTSRNAVSPEPSGELKTDLPLLQPSDMAIDERRHRLLVVDSARQALVAVDLHTQARSVVSGRSHPNSDVPFEFPTAVVVDHRSDRALVTDSVLRAVIAVDLQAGTRTVLSSDAVPGGQTPLLDPGYAVIDQARNRLLLIDTAPSVAPIGRVIRIVTVDLHTGARGILLDLGSGIDFRPTAAIALDASRDRLLVADPNTNSIAAVDLATGARSIVVASGGSWAPDFQAPSSLVVDSRTQRALVVDARRRALIEVDLITGDRKLLLDGPDGRFVGPYRLLFDETGMLLMLDRIERTVGRLELPSARVATR